MTRVLLSIILLCNTAAIAFAHDTATTHVEPTTASPTLWQLLMDAFHEATTGSATIITTLIVLCFVSVVILLTPKKLMARIINKLLPHS